MNASFFVPLVGITLMAIGLAGVAAAAWRSHKTSSRLDFIRSLGSEAELYAEAPPIVERVQEPLVNRIFGPAARGFRNTLSRLYPSSEVDRVHADLLKAGLTGMDRPTNTRPTFSPYVRLNVPGVGSQRAERITGREYRDSRSRGSLNRDDRTDQFD